MEPALRTEPAASGQAPSPSRHPLPWRNVPSDGENHVTDANGHAVYDGADAAEMFRLYNVEDLTERAEAAADSVTAQDGRALWARRGTR